MKEKNILFVTLTLLFSLSCMTATAQDQQDKDENAAKTRLEMAPKQPVTNLGKEVKTAKNQIVYPFPEDLIEESVRDIEEMQLTPEQYERIKRIFINREKQRASPYITPAKPITRTLPINLDPGIEPPILRLSRGQLSSIVFSDYKGDPWYISKVSLNQLLFSDAASRFVGNESEQQTLTNVLTLEPLTSAAYGNVTIMLKGLATPLIFILATGQNEVDMRVDVKVPGKNPDSLSTIIIDDLPPIDEVISYFLDGVPPKNAVRLKANGLSSAEAWRYLDDLYIRAKAEAQYPAYISAARSTSGVAVYRYSGVPNSVTFTTGGQAVTVFIE